MIDNGDEKHIGGVMMAQGVDLVPDSNDDDDVSELPAFEERIMTQYRFSGEVERYVFETAAPYTDAVIAVAEESSVMVEDTPKLISKKIRDHIEREASENRTLKRKYRKKLNHPVTDDFFV